MNDIVFNENTNTQELKNLNIFIDDDSIVENGVKLSYGVRILGNSIVRAGCVLGEDSVVENSILNENVEVKHSYIENSIINCGTTIGPFATIKKDSKIGENCRIGNFVEIKKSKIGANTKIAHLTYVGDAVVGKGCNIGCGVVFCNYNGEIKQVSIVGDNVFLGSNVNIIAPVNIGDWAFVAAGSTVNKDVEKDQFVIARVRQENKNNFKNPYKIKKKS